MNVGVFRDAAGLWNARAWAPNASSVALVSPAIAAPVNLGATGTGFWEGPVPGLSPGDTYELRVTRGDGNTLARLDPAARDTRNSSLDI